MLYGEKSKEQLNDHATNLFKKIVNIKEKRELFDNVQNKFGLTFDIVDNMIGFKRDIQEFTPFEIYCVLYFLDRKCLSKYFTQDELDFMENERIEKETVEFPITFENMVEIAPDQWIGKITTKQLMKLKKARLINYEEGEQRGYQKIKSGSTEIWKPFVSQKNVREIKKAMENDEYIPDPITLNMPEGAEYSFDYEKHTLKVKSLPKGMFNLDDGYHRYLAISQLYDFNQDFDYPMELRIVNFSNSKANRFIYQQDQKTPMKKIVSESMNPDAVANKIVNFLKQDSGCYVSGMIGRNGADINDAVLSKLVNHFFVSAEYKRGKKGGEMAYVMSIKNELKEKFNNVANQNAMFLNKYSDDMLFVTIAVFASDIPEDQYGNKIVAIMDKLTPEDKKMMAISQSNNIRKRSITKLNKLMEVV